MWCTGRKLCIGAGVFTDVIAKFSDRAIPIWVGTSLCMLTASAISTIHHIIECPLFVGSIDMSTLGTDTLHFFKRIGINNSGVGVIMDDPFFFGFDVFTAIFVRFACLAV